MPTSLWTISTIGRFFRSFSNFCKNYTLFPQKKTRSGLNGSKVPLRPNHHLQWFENRCYPMERAFRLTLGQTFAFLFALGFGEIAQLVEQRTENPCVPGSIPGLATTQTNTDLQPIRGRKTGKATIKATINSVLFVLVQGCLKRY